MRQVQLIPQNVVAMKRIDAVFVAPALAVHFSGQDLAAFADGASEQVAQVKTAADAFLVEAVETEHRFGVVEIDGVFDLRALSNPAGRVVSQVCLQAF